MPSIGLIEPPMNQLWQRLDSLDIVHQWEMSLLLKDALPVLVMACWSCSQDSICWFQVYIMEDFPLPSYHFPFNILNWLLNYTVRETTPIIQLLRSSLYSSNMQSHATAVPAPGNVIKPIELLDGNRCGICKMNFAGSSLLCSCNSR